ncbi:unnamed protein product [Nesidiocoris tenuis]|uniref:Uncharacterized protein n=1 Tax=Nesidiocoris tenuis TaxID=355587 RepID=A0A6H5G5W5_9HEMI|nr:unnamed protein product [Nesidiocoris tenuis]
MIRNDTYRRTLSQYQVDSSLEVQVLNIQIWRIYLPIHQHASLDGPPAPTLQLPTHDEDEGFTRVFEDLHLTTHHVISGLLFRLVTIVTDLYPVRQYAAACREREKGNVFRALRLDEELGGVFGSGGFSAAIRTEDTRISSQRQPEVNPLSVLCRIASAHRWDMSVTPGKQTPVASRANPPQHSTGTFLAVVCELYCTAFSSTFGTLTDFYSGIISSALSTEPVKCANLALENNFLFSMNYPLLSCGALR